MTEEDWKNIYKLSEERYQNWEWNYGKSPRFNFQNSKRLPVGLIEFRLDVKKGIIEECKIFGDFFGVGDVTEIEKLLVGVQYERTAITDSLKDIDVKHYFGNVTLDDIINIIY